MRNLILNKKSYYALKYLGTEDVVDGDGYKTGEKTVLYSRPVKFKAHISGARGYAQSEIFGTDINYDKTIVITKEDFDKLGFDENTVFFINIAPTYQDEQPLYDYRIERKSETLNEVVLAIKKVGR